MRQPLDVGGKSELMEAHRKPEQMKVSVCALQTLSSAQYLPGPDTPENASCSRVEAGPAKAVVPPAGGTG